MIIARMKSKLLGFFIDPPLIVETTYNLVVVRYLPTMADYGRTGDTWLSKPSFHYGVLDNYCLVAFGAC